MKTRTIPYYLLFHIFQISVLNMNHSRYGPLPVWSSRYGPPPSHYGPPELVIMVQLVHPNNCYGYRAQVPLVAFRESSHQRSSLLATAYAHWVRF